MKYEKAKAEAVLFDNQELFMFTSAEIAKIIASCRAWGCGGFSIADMETGRFDCGEFQVNICDIFDHASSIPGHHLYYIED